MAATASAVHCINMSVANLDHALAFPESFLGASARRRTTQAVASGAKLVCRDGPIGIDGGPDIGPRGAYVRIRDGAEVKLLQRPASIEESRP
jgi:hypothetical protein